MNRTIEPQLTPGSPSTGHRLSRSFLESALHISSACSLAISQSIYDRLGHQPEYLIDPIATPSAIACLVLTLSVALPGLLVLFTRILSWKNRSLGEGCHLAVMLLCSTLLALQIVRRWEFIPGWVNVVLAMVAGTVIAWAYDRFSMMRSFFTWSAVGVVIFPAIFLHQVWSSPAAVAYRATRITTGERPPVVLIVFDEFSGASLQTPEGVIDEVRFPRFAELQRSATWYRGAATVSPTTLRALPSLLTGEYVTSEVTPTPVTQPQNLFSLLAATGYDITAFEPVSILAPHHQAQVIPSGDSVWKNVCEMLRVLSRVYLFECTPADFHSNLPPVPTVWFGFHDSKDVNRQARIGSFRYGWTDRRDEQITHFLECLEPRTTPTLYFAHLLIPHSPWCFFPNGNRYAPDRNSQEWLCIESANSPMVDELGVIQNQQRQLLQVMYVDLVLGKIMDRLKEQGLWDRSLLVVMADHGVSFRLGQDRREFSDRNFEDILSIPCFVKRPGQTSGEISDSPIQTTDLLPTILDVLGVEPAESLPGLSVRDPKVKEREQLVVRDQSHDRVFPVDVVFRREVPRLIRTRFGEGTDRWNIYRIGPHPDWLGQPVSDHSLAQNTTEVELELISNPESHWPRPYHIEGRVVTPTITDRPLELVVAVNGVIVGTTRTYHHFGFTDRWEILLPEWTAFEVDPEPEFFAVTRDGKSLIPCRTRWVEVDSSNVAPSTPTP